MSLRQQGPSSAAVQRRLPDTAVAGFSWSCSPGVQRTVPDSQSGQADHLSCKGRLSPSMGADACYLSAFVSKWIAAACLECEPVKQNIFFFPLRFRRQYLWKFHPWFCFQWSFVQVTCTLYWSAWEPFRRILIWNARVVIHNLVKKMKTKSWK